MSDRELKLSVTEFKAKCLELFTRLAEGDLAQIVLTKHGKAIAEVRPASGEATRPRIYGSMRGRVMLPPDLDLSKPILDVVPLAARGILYLEDQETAFDGPAAGHLRADLPGKRRANAGRGAAGRRKRGG